MDQHTAINNTMHGRVAVIKAINERASKEEIIALLEACLKGLNVEATGDIQADAQTIVTMTGDDAFRRVITNYL